MKSANDILERRERGCVWDNTEGRDRVGWRDESGGG